MDRLDVSTGYMKCVMYLIAYRKLQSVTFAIFNTKNILYDLRFMKEFIIIG